MQFRIAFPNHTNVHYQSHYSLPIFAMMQRTVRQMHHASSRHKTKYCIEKGKGRFSHVFSAFDEAHTNEKELLQQEYAIMQAFQNSPYMCQVFDMGDLSKDIGIGNKMRSQRQGAVFAVSAVSSTSRCSFGRARRRRTRWRRRWCVPRRPRWARRAWKRCCS